MNDIMKIVQALEDSSILLKEVSKTRLSYHVIKHLRTSLSGNLLSGKGTVRAG